MSIADVIARSTMKPNMDLKPNEVDDPIFVAPNFFHIRDVGGNFVSLNPTTRQLETNGRQKVGGWECFHFKEGDRVAYVNTGLPLGARAVIVWDDTK
jgi:hypothetical protein